MKPEAIEQRVAAYDVAVKAGFPRYGSRGPAGKQSAAQRAAAEIGLRSPAAIIEALKAAEHADAVMAEQIRKTRQTRAQRRAEAIASATVYCGRTENLDGRRKSHIEQLADRSCARGGDRRAARRASPLAAVDEVVVRQARKARALTAERATAADALALDRLRDLPSGHGLALMRARGQLEVELFLTACEFRQSFELANCSPVSAINFAREKVDGGRAGFDPIFAADARPWLKRAADRVGERGYIFLVLVAVQGVGLLEAANKAGLPLEDERKRDAQTIAAARLREVLRDLGELASSGL